MKHKTRKIDMDDLMEAPNWYWDPSGKLNVQDVEQMTNKKVKKVCIEYPGYSYELEVIQ